MIEMEGLAARPVAPSGRTASNDVRAFLGVFESIFQTMRQSTSRMAALAEEKARQKTQDQVVRRTEIAAEHPAERSERRLSPDASEQTPPRHVERPDEHLRESARKTEGTERRDQVKAGKVRQAQASASKPIVPPNTANPPSEAGSVAAAPAPTFMDSPPVRQFEGQIVGNTVADGAVGKTTDGTAPAAQAAATGAISENAAASAGLNALVGLPVESLEFTPGASRGETGGQFARFQNSGAAATVKGGDGTTRTSGTATDFQNVLEGTARTRLESSLKGVKTVQAQKPANAASGTIDLNRPGSIRELAHIVRGRAGLRNSIMMLRLDPPELGQVRIEVRMHQQELTLRIQADTQAGHEALQSRVGDLRDALERQGIQIKEMDVEWRPPAPAPASPRDTNGQPPQGGAHDGSAFDRSGGQPDEGSHDPGSAPGDGPGNYDHSESVEKEEYDRIADLAETGVDLIV